MKNTILTFMEAKQREEKLTMLTCYDYSMAKLMDQAGIHSLLIGDSLGNVMMGYKNTLPVTVEDMIHHTACVSRGAENALIITDMPFMSYQASVYDGIVNAGRIIKEGGAEAVKLEGGKHALPVIRGIVDAQIPVCGHLGLTPQSVNAFGGYKVQGKSEDAAKQLIEDAIALEEAGCFAIVLEAIPHKLSKIITEKLTIPTIGIGAGPDCDGQVLVYQDMLGMFDDYVPKFVKQFANCGEIMKNAFQSYKQEVEEGTFPSSEHTFKINDDILNKLY